MAKSEIAVKLQQEVITAMKAREKARLGVLRMLQAAVKQVEVDQRREMEDEDVLKIFTSYARKVKDQISSYGDAGRDKLKNAAEAELKIVAEFLPVEMTDEELATIIAAAVAETGAAGPQDMGKVMKAVLAQTAGRADGGRVSALVKKSLVG
ncbi:MAG: GatB/YqeY domain-containing protein [Candidatus Krumholzibacteria bacterium]|nr:GatB/YqeY domain-containing protein [Candidatus Krumholzibacteria bacterium]